MKLFMIGVVVGFFCVAMTTALPAADVEPRDESGSVESSGLRPARQETFSNVPFNLLNFTLPASLLPTEELTAEQNAIASRIFTNTASNTQIKITLYTSATDTGTVLDVDTLTTITGSNFNNANPTKVIIHSYVPTGSRPTTFWPTAFRAALFTAIPAANVIDVDWVEASTTNYYQASTNVQFVATRVYNTLNALKDNKGLTADKIHMFGHGLGGHISGIAAVQFTSPAVGHITAFDPCGRQYLVLGNEVKLNVGDATFVEVIHTDDFGMGNKQPQGDVDIYFNGGKHQPGVFRPSIIYDPAVQSISLFTGGENVVSDNHFRGILYYQTAITDSATTYNVFQADDYPTFLLGNSFGTKVRFGPQIPVATRGQYFGATLRDSPYLSKTENYWVVKVGSGTRRLTIDVDLGINDLPTAGQETVINLDPEGGFIASITTGNERGVMVLPDGKAATDYKYTLLYKIPVEGQVVIADNSFAVTGLTISKAAATPAVVAGNCDALALVNGEKSAEITLTAGTECADAAQNLDALTITLLAVAGSVAGAGGLKLVVKLAKLLKGIVGLPGGKPINPKTKIKNIKILKAGIKALKLLKLAKLKKIFIVEKLIKGIKFLPLKKKIKKILKKLGGPGLKIHKLKEFLKDVKGLDKNNKNIVKKILKLLNKGDSDSLFEKIIGAIKGALFLG